MGETSWYCSIKANCRFEWKEEPYFLDDQAKQRVADLLTQDKSINDDFINIVQ
jgi:hypothetical protein